MLKVFPIDFVRQILEQTLEKEHIENVNYFGGKDQVNIFSFYEQLKNQDEVNRFVENYRDLTEQQNRTGLIGNGVVVAPENPTITNLYSSLIVPMSWTCSMRCTLENRDAMLGTLNNLVYKLKGKKVDVAQLNCVDENGNHYTQPFVVGTIGNNDGQPTLKNGDYIGNITTSANAKTFFDNLITNGVSIDKNKEYLLYANKNNEICVYRSLYYGDGEEMTAVETQLDETTTSGDSYTLSYEIYVAGDYAEAPEIHIKADIEIDGINQEHKEFSGVKGVVTSSSCLVGVVVYYVDFVVSNEGLTGITTATLDNISINIIDFEYEQLESGETNDIVFPPEHYSFEKFKVSLSFDAMRCDEPRNLNAKEYCEISFGGSATLVSNGVSLGNDLLKVGIKKDKYITATGEQVITSTREYLEPLEMPSGSNANTLTNQLTSNLFKTNTHTDSLALTLQYTFIADMNSDLISQWFDYARYGAYQLSTGITPNIIYSIWEIWCSWGNYQKKEVIAKIVENIDIENTESDTITLSMTMQIQGENN